MKVSKQARRDGKTLFNACCVNGVCFQVTEATCQSKGGVWKGNGTPCTSTTCAPPPPTGAC